MSEIDSKLEVDVIVHPLVLLSVSDHQTRIAATSKRRVVGVLLGHSQVEEGRLVVDITNTFAIPQEEEPNNPQIWFFDKDQLETTYAMFKQVSMKEFIVGWQGTGRSLRDNDIQVNEEFRTYCTNPVQLKVDTDYEVNSLETRSNIPCKAFLARPVLKEDGALQLVFKNVKTKILASEPEEVGVEHLLRDHKDLKTKDLKGSTDTKLESLRIFKGKLATIKEQLGAVRSGKVARNEEMLSKIQDIFNQKKNEVDLSEFSRDSNLMVYSSNLIRTLLKVDDLVNNRLDIKNKEKEKLEKEKKDKEKQEEKEKKDKAKKDNEDNNMKDV